MNKNERKYWTESFSTIYRECPYCGSVWPRGLTQNIFVNFCPKCGERVFKEDELEEENNEGIRTC